MIEHRKKFHLPPIFTTNNHDKFPEGSQAGYSAMEEQIVLDRDSLFYTNELVQDLSGTLPSGQLSCPISESLDVINHEMVHALQIIEKK